MTKNKRIMAMHARGLNTRQIAQAIYGKEDMVDIKVRDRRMSYVRVVIRQRKGKGMSEFDRAYHKTDKYREIKRRQFQRRYYSDEQFRLACIASAVAYYKKRYASDPVFRAKEAARRRAYYWRTRAAA